MAKKELMMSPRGVAVYPHLNAPDVKFKAEGKLHTKLRCTADDAAPLVEKLKEMQQKAFAEAKADPKNKGKKVKLADLPFAVDDETGEVTFTFSTQASGISKKTGEPWVRKLAVYDAAGVALKPIPKVGGGSVLKVSFEPGAFYTALVGAGVTLRLEAVQIIKLEEWGDRSASSYGFEKEEGYTATSSELDAADETDGDEEASEDEAEEANAADF